MRKNLTSKSSCNKSAKSIIGSALSQRKNCGYRPSGNRSSDCSSVPNGGSSIQNIKNK